MGDFAGLDALEALEARIAALEARVAEGDRKAAGARAMLRAEAADRERRLMRQILGNSWGMAALEAAKAEGRPYSLEDWRKAAFAVNDLSDDELDAEYKRLRDPANATAGRLAARPI